MEKGNSARAIRIPRSASEEFPGIPEVPQFPNSASWTSHPQIPHRPNPPHLPKPSSQRKLSLHPTPNAPRPRFSRQTRPAPLPRNSRQSRHSRSRIATQIPQQQPPSESSELSKFRQLTEFHSASHQREGPAIKSGIPNQRRGRLSEVAAPAKLSRFFLCLLAGLQFVLASARAFLAAGVGPGRLRCLGERVLSVQKMLCVRRRHRYPGG